MLLLVSSGSLFFGGGGAGAPWRITTTTKTKTKVFVTTSNSCRSSNSRNRIFLPAFSSLLFDSNRINCNRKPFQIYNTIYHQFCSYRPAEEAAFFLVNNQYFFTRRKRRRRLASGLTLLAASISSSSSSSSAAEAEAAFSEMIEQGDKRRKNMTIIENVGNSNSKSSRINSDGVGVIDTSGVVVDGDDGVRKERGSNSPTSVATNDNTKHNIKGDKQNAAITTTPKPFLLPPMTIIVAACGKTGGIGVRGALPWRIPGDMKYFKQVTCLSPKPELMNAVIMGRKTWESIPSKFKPLPNRINVILSSKSSSSSSLRAKEQIKEQEEREEEKKMCVDVDGDGSSDRYETNENVIWACSLQDARMRLASMDNVGDIFVIGGGQVYKEALNSGDVKNILLTKVDVVVSTKNEDKKETLEFDTFFPLPSADWECLNDHNNRIENEINVDPKSGYKYQFLEYIPKKETKNDNKTSTENEGGKEQVEGNIIIEEGPEINPEEMQYLNICQDILSTGIERGDRTGTGTLSKFGIQMRFSLRNNTLPLLTTKRTFWRGVAEELLWFIKGCTNGNELSNKNIRIWDGNGSREFLDGRGLFEREVGDLGPIYGFQWRHFGADYTNMHADYTGKGVDQLAECIHKIKTNPEDRRIILSAWNPSDISKMALPPCHMFCQFYVDTQKHELHCQMYQRSADMGLGVPFNIASYALLTHLIAHVTGYKAGEFVHVIGDAHVYLNHVDALKKQLERKPRIFPKLKINFKKENIDDFVFEDFEILDYNPHGIIKMKMAV